MLKDITLGQYFPGTSPLHRMDPRTKLLILVLYIVTIFCCGSLIPFALCTLGLLAAIKISRISPKLILKSLKPIVIIVIFTGVLNILYTPGDVLASFWIFRITREGIETAAIMITRILLLVASTALTFGVSGLVTQAFSKKRRDDHGRPGKEKFLPKASGL